MTEINYDDLAETPVTQSDDELKSIAELAERQCTLEDWIEKAEGRLKEAKRNLMKVTGELLPDALKQAGLESITLANGAKVEVNADLKASITKANQAAAFEWMREHNHGDLIRNEFKISYGVGEDEQSDCLTSFLAEVGQDFNEKTFVNAQSLKAWCRRELEAHDHGEDWEKMFGVYRFKYTKIERPKT